MTFGEFLQQIFEWIYRFWPIRTVHDWEQGVRCLLGNATGLLTAHNGVFETGLHFCWPIAGEIAIFETNIEVSETPLQTVTSASGEDATFSLGVKYRIFDLKRMFQNIHDPVETLENEICSAAGRCVAVMPFSQLSLSLCEQVLLETRKEMAEWGIEVESLSLINLSQAQPLRLILDRSPKTNAATS